MTLEDCAVIGNTCFGDYAASRDRGTYGGGIYANGLDLRDSVISGNAAIGYGAAGGDLLGRRLDAGSEAVARSAVLGALVLGLAWLTQRGQPELVWLVYPLVAAGALKLLLHDVRAGRPATLVASLGLYGSLLILLPRLLKARERPAC